MEVVEEDRVINLKGVLRKCELKKELISQLINPSFVAITPAVAYLHVTQPTHAVVG